MGEVGFGEVKRADVSPSPPTEAGDGLRFESVKVDAGGKRLLWGVSGHAPPGKMLAVMGPSGEPTPTDLRLHCRFVGYFLHPTKPFLTDTG